MHDYFSTVTWGLQELPEPLPVLWGKDQSNAFIPRKSFLHERREGVYQLAGFFIEMDNVTPVLKGESGVGVTRAILAVPHLALGILHVSTALDTVIAWYGCSSAICPRSQQALLRNKPGVAVGAAQSPGRI